MSKWRQYVITFNPSDYPGKYVVRVFDLTPTLEAKVFDTLEDARKSILPGLIRIARHPSDDPVIVETWL